MSSFLSRSGVRLLARPASLARPAPSTPIRTVTSQSSTRGVTSTARNLLYAGIFTASAGLFTIYYLDSRSSIHRYVVMPAARALFDAETGHKLAVKALKYGVTAKDQVEDDESLRSEVRKPCRYTPSR